VYAWSGEKLLEENVSFVTGYGKWQMPGKPGRKQPREKSFISEAIHPNESQMWYTAAVFGKIFFQRRRN